MIKAVELRKVGERQIDLPEQHRRTCGRTAVTRTLAIDHDDIVAEARQMFGHERACNSTADDQHIAAHVAVQRLSPNALESAQPRGAAAAQIELFGRALI